MSSRFDEMRKKHLDNNKQEDNDSKQENVSEDQTLKSSSNDVNVKIKSFEDLIEAQKVSTEELKNIKDKLIEDKNKKSEELEVIVESLNKITTLNEKIMNKVNENNSLKKDIDTLNTDVISIDKKLNDKLAELQENFSHKSIYLEDKSSDSPIEDWFTMLKAKNLYCSPMFFHSFA